MFTYCIVSILELNNECTQTQSAICTDEQMMGIFFNIIIIPIMDYRLKS